MDKYHANGRSRLGWLTKSQQKTDSFVKNLPASRVFPVDDSALKVESSLVCLRNEVGEAIAIIYLCDLYHNLNLAKG